jgi:hypothetical protein
MNRRSLLLLVLGVTSLDWLDREQPSFRDSRRIDSSALALRIRKVVGAVRLPDAWGGGLPSAGRGDAELVGAVVNAEASDWAALIALADEDLRSRIRGSIESDYRAGRLEYAHGWCLSFTEASLLALLQRSA